MIQVETVVTPVRTAPRVRDRQARPRGYLMCPPEHIVVPAGTTAWADTDADPELAGRQWDGLRRTLLDLGHTVHVLPAAPGLPGMVYTAAGGFSVDGVVYGGRSGRPVRERESELHWEWYESHGWDRFVLADETNEGGADLAYLPACGLILAGHGFRTTPAAHVEAQETLVRPVISLRLTDPRFRCLDSVLAVLDDDAIAYWPGGFSDASRQVLEQLFPDAVVADEADALSLGLSLVGDGRHVVLDAAAEALAGKLAARGYVPVMIDLSELRKGGVGARGCVAELRP